MLTLLQRNQPPEEPKEKKSEATSSSPATDREIIEKRVLKSLSMMKPWQLEKSKPILRKFYDSSDVSINENGYLFLDDRPTSLEATSFLYNLQQPKSGLHDPDYQKILSKIDISLQSVPNTDAKTILQPSVVKKKITKLKTRPRKNVSPRKLFPGMSHLSMKKRALRDAGTVSEADFRKLEALYRKGPAAYGSVANLKKASGLSWRKVNNFLQGKNSHTKYRQFPRRFPRLKVIAFDINEIWSIDVAHVDKLAKYNHGVKYLLVAVDVLMRKLRVPSCVRNRPVRQ